MRTQLTDAQIAFYRENGFVVVDGLLDEVELEVWRAVFGRAVAARAGKRVVSVHGGNRVMDALDDDYYDGVFDQLVNLWQTDEALAELILHAEIGAMAAALAGVERLRVWHDQALVKQPFANPTAFHQDAPYWSFDSPDAITIWIALDDATLSNGCLYFAPASHRDQIENNGIGRSLGAIFGANPGLRSRAPVPAEMRAGSCSFHNGLTVHGAGANMTTRPRRALTCSYMPDGSVYNGQQNILADAYVARLAVGDPLDDPAQNPLVV